MKTRFFALAMLALALVACNNDNENLNGDPVAAQFTASIAPATRASGTTWTGGDRIGITDIGNDSQYGNVPFILKNGKFEAEGKVIYIEDTKPHTFRAYYPYNAAGGILTATTDATAQQNQADGNLTSSVILFPQTVASLPLVVNYKGQEYHATLTMPEGALQAGNNYTYTVKVRNKVLEVSEATIAKWNDINGGEVNAGL